MQSKNSFMVDKDGNKTPMETMKVILDNGEKFQHYMDKKTESRVREQINDFRSPILTIGANIYYKAHITYISI